MSPHDPDRAKAPEQIYIIRHGEKPADLPPPAPGQPPVAPSPPFGVDVNGNQDDHSLIPRGWQRSGALTVLFAPAVGAACGAGCAHPTALYSPSYGDPAKTQAHRTYQTILGLSERIGLYDQLPVPGRRGAAAGQRCRWQFDEGRPDLLGTRAHPGSRSSVPDRPAYRDPEPLARPAFRHRMVVHRGGRRRKSPIHVQPNTATAFGRGH